MIRDVSVRVHVLKQTLKKGQAQEQRRKILEGKVNLKLNEI